jgi:lactate dehydrogenase-like 2-hydroxyacid dehydrogenase
MNRISILTAGKIHPRVTERLSAHFDVIHIEKADPAFITPEIAVKVRGATAFNGMPSSVMAALPHLEIVANFGVGYDGVDVGHAAANGIMVTNTPDVLNEEVADTALGLLINTVRLLPQAEAWLRAGRWAKDGSFALSPLSLRGRTVGIYGLGRIGQAIATRVAAFNLAVHYHTRSPRADVGYTYHATLEALADAVDTMICIVPKTPETHKTINAEILRKLGPEGVLINVGRGWTVDEDDLAAALRNGTIAAAGLDVFQDEPHVPEALIALPNACLLPHVASASVPTRNAMADLASDNLISWFKDGKPLTPVPETPHKA